MNTHSNSTPAAPTLGANSTQSSTELPFTGPNAAGLHIEAAVRPYCLRIIRQPGGLRLEGDELAVTLATRMLGEISALAQAAEWTNEAVIADTVASVVQTALKHDLAHCFSGFRHPLRSKSLSQAAFIDVMLRGDRPLIFGVGPTGTGKTHLAIAAGLGLVLESRFKRLILTRPHVRMEGEIITPELRAEIAEDEQLTLIEDVLRDLIGREEVRRLTDHGSIEIMPLGRMRGRTFNESFIVVDEAQNMSVRKMRMAVTRLGNGSRMVVAGDPDQNDLRGHEPSGLTHLMQLVAGTDLACVHRFQTHEIVRNDFVARIETLYSRNQSLEAQEAA